MKNHLALVALIFTLMLLASCDSGNPSMKRLHGVWLVDVEATLLLDASLNGLSPREREEALEISRGLLSNMTLDFDANKGTVTTSIGHFKETVPAGVQSDDGARLVLKGGSGPVELSFQDENTLLARKEGQTLVLRRRK